MTTSYYQKYLKYKQKYLNLLQQIAGEKYVLELKDLYPSPIHDSSFSKSYNEHKITYGELTYEGIEAISNKYNDIEQFLDVGSGRGKLCLYMAHKQNIDLSVGIELVEERYKDAIDLRNRLSVEYESITSKVKLVNSDIFEYTLDGELDKKTLVYFSNLCFEQETSNKVIIKLIKELKSGSIIVCSQEFNQQHTSLRQLENIIVKQSWHSESVVYSYEII
jgi:hypothetical protein